MANTKPKSSQVIYGKNSQPTVENAIDALQPALAMATTFTMVPTTFQSYVIFVTQPHFRTFVWTGTKYERAPWHRPGEIISSDGPSSKITNAIQMRSDVVYNTADYPDLAEFYGFTGPTFVLKDGRARVIRGADLGRNIDTALVNGYLQEDAGRNLTGSFSVLGSGAALGAFTKTNVVSGAVPLGDSYALDTVVFDASNVWPTATEFRVKSLVATYYVTI